MENLNRIFEEVLREAGDIEPIYKDLDKPYEFDPGEEYSEKELRQFARTYNKNDKFPSEWIRAKRILKAYGWI